MTAAPEPPRPPLIADIKRNALDDGPGIRTTVFFKGCPLACVWCHNPECASPSTELLVRTEPCIACGECAEVCPTGAIGDGPLAVDRAVCTLCGTCVDTCPAGAREIIGRRYELDELVEVLEQDVLFYQSSGGGVTLSGGETTLFCEFAGAVARRLREAGIHVLLETCGHFGWDRFEAHLLASLDVIYFDLKLVDGAAHRRHCGRGNRRILQNLERLATMAPERPELLVRMPLVAGITATRDNLDAAAALLTRLGIGRVQLMPYNPLWHAKAAGLGHAVRYSRDRWLDEDELEVARRAFDGFEVIGLSAATVQV